MGRIHKKEEFFMKLGTKLFCAVALAALTATAAFSAYPNKQITVIQGFKAGGGSDAIAQMTQPFLEKILGQTFVNQYLPGAAGAIGYTRLAKGSKPDGYTIGIINTPHLYADYIMNPSISYRLPDVIPLANIVTDPGVIVVAQDSPIKDAADFLATVKEAGGKMTIGNGGVGSDDFFSSLIFKKLTGIDFQMIPFEGDGPAWQAAMGKKVDVTFTNIGIAFPQIKAGNLRPLAIFANARYDQLPDVPTMKELGIDLVNGSSRGYAAPAGTPKEIVDTLIDAFKKMAAMPEFQQVLIDRATIMDMMCGEDFANWLAEQDKTYVALWDEVKGQLQK